MTKKKTQVQKKELGKKESGFQIFYKHLVNGIGYMIPIIVAAGFIFALSFLIDTCSGIDPKTMKDPTLFGQVTIAAKIFHYIGDAGLGLAFSILSCFIAKSIAGNRAIAPGFIAGLMTREGVFSIMYLIASQSSKEIIVPLNTWAASASGFIGCLFAGFISGYLVLAFAKLLKGMKGTWTIVRDIMLLPIIVTIISTMSMFVLNGPLALINIGINQGLTAMLNANEKLLYLIAALVAGLMCIDMGGPINKAAHFFCLSLVRDPLFKTDVAWGLMAANIVGIMTPPIAIAIATWLFPKKFTRDERMPSIGNCFIGLCGVTEPAIPYVAKDPLRVIGSCVFGSSVGGLVCYAIGGQAIAPEGGTISLITMGGICWKAIISTLLASAIAAVCLGFLKKNADPTLAKVGNWKGIPLGNGVGSLSVKNIKASRIQLDNEYKIKKAKLVSKHASKEKINNLTKKYDGKHKKLEAKYKKYLAKQNKK